jgi:hypothetical protein
MDELKTIESLGKLGRWTLGVTDAALYSLLCHWRTKFGELEVFCDESKPLSTYLTGQPSLFAAMVGRKDTQYIELGSKRRAVTFCLARPVSAGQLRIKLRRSDRRRHSVRPLLCFEAQQ